MPNKPKPNSYPKIYGVNVADGWRERLRTLTGEVCTVCYAEHLFSMFLSNPYRKVWLSVQKSAQAVVPEKSMKIDGGKGLTVGIRQTLII